MMIEPGIWENRKLGYLILVSGINEKGLVEYYAPGGILCEKEISEFEDGYTKVETIND